MNNYFSSKALIFSENIYVSSESLRAYWEDNLLIIPDFFLFWNGKEGHYATVIHFFF